MTKTRRIHPDFLFLMELKEQRLCNLFKDRRVYILEYTPIVMNCCTIRML